MFSIQASPFSSCALLIAAVVLVTSSVTAESDPRGFEFEAGDRIAYIGNALADRKQHDGWLESYLQAAYPNYELVFRNLGVSGDQVDHRPRAHEGFGSPDTHLSRIGATVIFAFFGYNESYDDQPAAYRDRLIEWVEHARSQQYDGEQAPRIVLFSPIAHENLGDPRLPDGSDNNRRLAAYARATAEAAERTGVGFVNLFSLTQQLYEREEQPLTINGVHLSSDGNRQAARSIVEQLTGSLPADEGTGVELLREAVLDKNWHWLNRYRATSGNDVWGSRSNLHGNYEVLQHELRMIDVMTANRDERIWALARGEEDFEVDDSNVPPPVEVETNYEFGEDLVDDPAALVLAVERGNIPDAKADKRVVVMTGIDSADTHHTANNLILGPDGYIYYQRGVFHLHNVESPWGPSHQSTASGLYRFNPRTYRFENVVSNSPNPHGISFDRWGYQYITDATSGSPFQVYVGENGFQSRRLFDQTLRPVAGNQVLSSGHLPEEFENNFLIYNTIGFLGAKRYELGYEHGLVRGEEIGDLFVF